MLKARAGVTGDDEARALKVGRAGAQDVMISVSVSQ